MLKEAVLSACPDLDVRMGEVLSAYTTFRIGGPARLMILPKSTGELASVLRICSEMGENPVILGNGSNVLAPDEGLDRVVVCTKNLNGIRVDGTCITVEAGCTMARLATVAMQNGLTGLEFAHGIPGTVGGGTMMNAGAYGGELKDVVTSVCCLTVDGILEEKTAEQLDFGYRHSCFEGTGDVIVSVTMQLQPGVQSEIKARMDELAGKRRASQPLEFPSAGSTFKRPEGYFAGKLIQDADLKGRSVGGAQVSPKHGGFVVNTGGATCQDVLALVKLIQSTVYQKSGVMLELEVRLL